MGPLSHIKTSKKTSRFLWGLKRRGSTLSAGFKARENASLKPWKKGQFSSEFNGAQFLCHFALSLIAPNFPTIGKELILPENCCLLILDNKRSSTPSHCSGTVSSESCLVTWLCDEDTHEWSGERKELWVISIASPRLSAHHSYYSNLGKEIANEFG